MNTGDKIIRRKVYFGAFHGGDLLDKAPLFLKANELETLNRDGVVLASDGYEYQVLKDQAVQPEPAEAEELLL